MLRMTEAPPAVRPGGLIARQYDDHTWLVESPDGSGWIEAPGLRIPVTAEEMQSARHPWRNLVAAKLHEADDAIITGLFAEFTYDDRWAAAVAAGAAKAVA